VQLLIVSVGRSRDPTVEALVERYARRCPWTIALREVQLRGRVPAERRKEAEAMRLLAAVPDTARIVTLDESGRELDSKAFAARLGDWRDSGERCIAFLVGGADGHGEAALRRADLVLSLGRMTWPHELVRVLLVEQLYRAATILAGHPYHRD
jgi:23S rRNA (pseudouridine1915-N3)-methyltransferase